MELDLMRAGSERGGRHHQEDIVIVGADQVGAQGVGTEDFSGLAVDGYRSDGHAAGNEERDTAAQSRARNKSGAGDGGESEIGLKSGFDGEVFHRIGRPFAWLAIARGARRETGPDIKPRIAVRLRELASDDR